MNTSTTDNWQDNTFLSHVAEDLMSRFGGDLMGVTLVFPNKRARLFMNEELLGKATSAMWAPEYSTIAELFESIVGDNVCETIPAVCTLYNVYKDLMGSNAETLDMFWGWGEIILSDFDDIDKHLVNANSLFLNALQLDQMGNDLDFLTPEQLNALKQFFGSFTPENKTRLQEQFTRLWSIMPGLYQGLKDSMPEGIQPYQGALERQAVEEPGMLHLLDTTRTYCFIGFNMLSETEKKLMDYLKNQGKALFYWDYDIMYADNDKYEAGDFIRQNLKTFPNALPGNIYDNLRHKTEFTFVSTSTDSIATRYIPEWLATHLTPTERQTALVLCDESQLQPTLHSIPDDSAPASPRDINITMGYPITGTPVHSLVLALVALQTEGWDAKRRRFRLPFLKSISYHPYHQYMDPAQWEVYHDPSDIPSLVMYLDQVIMSIAQKMKQEEAFDDVLMVESIYAVHRTLLQFHDMATNSRHPLVLHPTTLRRLLRRVLSSQSIPFHGEPAQGLQVMGVLETRCLDFRNLLMLNVGEGFLPKSGADNSLIPHTLRIGFGLTTPRHRIAVFAYYFYRLIQRAQHVTFVYNENSTGNVRHEMSRFLRQLQAETDIPIRCLRLEAEQDTTFTTLDTIPKDPDILQAMHRKYNLLQNPQARALSPSAMNVFKSCPMQFYLSSICGIREEPDPDDGVDPRLLGTIVHNVAENVYREIMRRTGTNEITRSHLSEFTKDKGRLLQPMIDSEFEKEAGITDFRGENILVRSVAETYLMNLFRWDERHAPITIEQMEYDMYTAIDTEVVGTQLRINTGGRIDRMDIITEAPGVRTFRIVDYKTGSHENKPTKIEDLFKLNNTHAAYYFQTFLYSLAVKRSGYTDLPIKPVLFYTAKSGKSDYDPTLKIGEHPVQDISAFEQPFEQELQKLIQEIFDPTKDFTKAQNTDTCKYCDFKKLCGR